MRRSVRIGRSLTSGGLLFLLAAPLALVGHAHPADHDGATHHVEVPHGEHELALADGPDRLPSTQLDRPVGAPASVQTAPGAEPKALDDLRVPDAELPPARAPPRQHRSRAPPLPF